MSEDILDHCDGNLLTITFNRPERRNCLNPQVMNELEGLVREVRNDSEVRVLVVTDAGAAFSAGADISAVKGLRNREERARVFSARRGGVARAVGRALNAFGEILTNSNH